LENIFAFQAGIVGEKLFNAAPRTDLTHNHAHGHTLSAYVGFSTHDTRILSDVIELWHCHLQTNRRILRIPCPFAALNYPVAENASRSDGLFLAQFRDGEIEMVVVAAAGVEGGAALGARRVTLQILGNGELGAAGSAEDGRRVPFGLGPGFEGMGG
jgi:hypothetical protein